MKGENRKELNKKLSCEREGETFTTSEGYKVKITEYIDAKNITVEFENGYKTKVQYIQLLKGNVKNPYNRSCYGVGFVGDGIYKTKTDGKHTKAYTVWRGMISRCYNPKYQEVQKTYVGCEVSDEWLNFQNFADWFYNTSNHHNGWELDKDFIKFRNKKYSKETCCFLPKWLNVFVSNNTNKNTSGATGILKTKSGKWKVQINEPFKNKRIHLGTYETEDESKTRYKEKRKEGFLIAMNSLNEIKEGKFISKLILEKIEKEELF